MTTRSLLTNYRQILVVIVVFRIDIQDDDTGVGLFGCHYFVFVNEFRAVVFFGVLVVVQGDVAQDFFAAGIVWVWDLYATV